jgi:hypothetical protein
MLALPKGEALKTYGEWLHPPSLSPARFAHAGHQFNLLAGAWIQFQVHDWVDHTQSDKTITLNQGAEHGCPMAKFQFRETEKFALNDPKTGRCAAYPSSKQFCPPPGFSPANVSVAIFST